MLRAARSSPISYAASTASTAPRRPTPRRARAPRRAPRPRATRRPRFTRQTTPTAWSIESSFVRRPAPSSSAAMPIASAPRRVTTPSRGARTSRTTGAVGRTARSGSPPCARIQRSYASQRRAVGHRCLGAPPPLGDVDPEIGEREQARARVEHELREVRRALPGDRLDRLADLERVADRGAERLVHVGEEAHDLPAGPPPEVDHLLGEDARVVERLHERAVADLHVEHDRIGPRRDLLRHDRRGDERDDVDRGGDVAERVELLVGRHEVAGLPDDRETDVAHLRDELVDRELDPEARDRLELVERARPCGRARGRTSSRTARRTRRRSARPRATSCPPRRPSSACRRPVARARHRGRASRRSGSSRRSARASRAR